IFNIVEGVALVGGLENDTLAGGLGNDHLAGGTDTDRLEGGLGDDIYYFARGDGADTVFDDYWFDQQLQQGQAYTYNIQVWHPGGEYETGSWQPSPRTAYNNVTVAETVQADGGRDVLEFGPGIALADIVTETSGQNLIVGVRGETDPAGVAASSLSDRIVLENWFDPD
ncbi:MAG: hypothetical protein GY778_23500, partial [bacterium]|nr:hypothetical protein [bacterium]